jgi:predicted dehydrogenase
MKRDKIVVVGCGAIGDLFYFPHLAANDAIRSKVCLVDRDSDRLQVVKAKWGFPFASVQLEDFLPEARVGVVATPPGSHAQIGMTFLQVGADIVVEKPLANSYEDGVALCDEADRRGRQILVNNTRRFYPQSKAIQKVITSGQYGALRRIEHLEGDEFAWPTVSGFYFQQDSGRGVLSDRGSHIFDLICWWLGQEPTLTEARTNSRGGVEGLAECRLGFPTGEARIKVSWHNKMANLIRLEFDEAVVEADLYQIDRYAVTRNGHTSTIKCPGDEKNNTDCSASFCRALLDLYSSRAPVPVAGRDVLTSLKLIDKFYASAQPFEETWLGT